MSLRRFLVLTRGLGPNSATLTALRAETYVAGPDGRYRRVSIPQTAEDADRAADVLFGTGGSSKVH